MSKAGFHIILGWPSIVVLNAIGFNVPLKLLRFGNYRTPHILKELDISDKTLYAWLRAYKQKNNLQSNTIRSYKTKSSTESLEEENRRLRKELKDVKMEKEILKKAAAYFAKETL